MFTILTRIEPSIADRPTSYQSLTLECPQATQIGQPTTVHVTFINSSDRTEHYQIITEIEGLNDGWGDIMPDWYRSHVILAPQETKTIHLDIPAEADADTIFVEVHATLSETQVYGDPAYWAWRGSCYISLVQSLWLQGIFTKALLMNLSAGAMLLGIASLAYSRRPLKEKRKRLLFEGENND
jgi:hypothetical protein